MSILKQKQDFFNTVIAHIPKQLHRQFDFGFNILSVKRINSVRSNARKHINNFHTAKSKAYRLTDNSRWLKVLPQVLTRLGLVTATSKISLDFSTFGYFQVLTFAVQTKQGRALPVYFEIITYPIKKDSQNIFICDAIERFAEAVGCRPKLVMDRGFACPHIIKTLASLSHPFIVRIKGMKTLVGAERRLIFKAQQALDKDLAVYVYKHTLRLVVSDDPSNGNQPWYLITNDIVSVRDGIITDYYHRFEIEEFFKDAKWLQGLEHLHFKKIQSMSIVLWFVILGWWFMALLKRSTRVVQGKHTHDKLSFPRLIMEALEREEQHLLAVLLAQTEGDKLCLLCS